MENHAVGLRMIGEDAVEGKQKKWQPAERLLKCLGFFSRYSSDLFHMIPLMSHTATPKWHEMTPEYNEIYLCKDCKVNSGKISKEIQRV